MAPKTVKSRSKATSRQRTRRPSARLNSARLRTGQARKTTAAAIRVPSVTKPFKGKLLSRREIAELRQMLEAERERLMDELEAMEEHTPEVEEQVGMDIGGGYDEDLADVASVTFEREKSVALESSVQQTLSQVEEALQRIEDRTYGRCQRCGNAIDYARLKVLPYATLCIRCKELEEKSGR